ncbi:hypothetical protein G7Y89_g47 [Cudoniella acicularis]|uniref:Conserved oligomeric Golgi complex subunit 1 n=1 Tax=Cudoniella acicularis TaxID=354080 RepID=A0A8H4W898_9HELO|nr:hypothetical protein G7Y89_g47 [Cudoniella acicularis]
MAANKNLDPTSCTTAAEAFKYPLPQVRQFHRSLTGELDEKNARLRTLVGGSYRQLLGTAETILQMRENIDVVEEKLGKVGNGCGRGVINGMAGGLGKLQSNGSGGTHAKNLGWSARMKVLTMCNITVGRLLKRTPKLEAEAKIERAKHFVVAAKVLVLSRLLAKTVGEMISSRSKIDQEAVEEARKKRASLQKRFLRAVDKTLERTDGDATREDLVQALCAYSLATSSGSKDVLRHFLRVRGQALALSLDDDEETPGVIRALELYTRTLLDVQSLVPRRLSEALAGLKVKALLKDESIRNIEGLRLDVCERWFGDEILFFIPYIRHDDLEGPLVVENLRGWASKASEVLLQGLAKSLQRKQEFKTVVDLRTKILKIWIKEGGKAKGFDPSIMLDGLRKVVNNRMLQLIESRLKKLHLVATEVEGTLASWEQSASEYHGDLWDSVMLDMEVTHGATLFKQAVLSRTHGRNDAVSRAFKGYQTWRQLVDEIITALDQLKKQRWDDDLEDIEDDLTLESRNTLLNVEDPFMLQDHLNSCLVGAYKDLYDKIASLLVSNEDNVQIGPMSIYIIRVIRDLRSELPKMQSLQGFGLPLVSQLHEKLASTVSDDSIKQFAKSVVRKKVAGRSLWEGNPELPVQPSPATFKLLNNLTLTMAKFGGDLWSPTAVRVLKKYVRAEIGRSWKSSLREQEDVGPPKLNGDDTSGDTEVAEAAVEDQSYGNGAQIIVKRKGVLTQALFDALLLQNSFELPEGTLEDELQALGDILESKIGLDLASQKRLGQAVKEYWKRTGLLFGLLA